MYLYSFEVYTVITIIIINIHILQVFFLQDLQDLTQNLASLALKIKLFLQDMKNLARILQEKYLTIVSCKILARFFLSYIFSARLARYVQDLVQNLASLARKILSRFAYFLQDGFYWAL